MYQSNKLLQLTWADISCSLLSFDNLFEMKYESSGINLFMDFYNLDTQFQLNVENYIIKCVKVCHLNLFVFLNNFQ